MFERENWSINTIDGLNGSPALSKRKLGNSLKQSAVFKSHILAMQSSPTKIEEKVIRTSCVTKGPRYLHLTPPKMCCDLYRPKRLDLNKVGSNSNTVTKVEVE